MADRYQRVFSMEGDLYVQGSPVLIKAGALLVDNVTNKVLAQLKFQNISDQIIKAIKVALYPMDTVGRALGETVEYQYLDLNEKRDAEFGSKVPIYFENTSVRSFSAKVTEIAFADNSVWNCATEWVRIPEQKELSAVLRKELKEQYRITIGNDSADYVAEQTQDLWLCTCGAINRGHESQCHKCNLAYETLVAELDEEKLTKARESRLAEIARKKEKERINREEAAAKKREEDKIAAKKRGKKVLITLLILVLVVGAVFASMYVWKNIIVPNQIKNDFIESYGQDVYDRYGVVEDETASFIVEYGFDIYDNYGVISTTDADFIVEFGEELYDKYGVLEEDDVAFINEYGLEIYDEYGIVNDDTIAFINEYGGIGSSFYFGSYEQDNDVSNVEPIEWVILEVEDGRALLISKYGLDAQPYNTDWTGVTWQTCTLRSWLNNEFVQAAFSKQEQVLIPTVTVTADSNPSFDTNTGKDTQDQVFLLSIEEANRWYVNGDGERTCKATAYAVARGAYNHSNGNCGWWLRSPGSDQDYASHIGFGGEVINLGSTVDTNITVRPTIWLDLSALLETVQQ